MQDSAKAELVRWLGTVVSGMSDPQRRIVETVLSHYDVLRPLGTAAGKRAKRLVELLEAQRGSAVRALEVAEIAKAASEFPFYRLLALEVGPFRGFRTEENLDLDADRVLLYGPNGSGKTSFCEALEYALLGRIEEAESRRIKLIDYIRHAREGKGAPPKLRVRLLDDSAGEIPPDGERYRFCFIERNRIEGFARIDSETPASQTARLSALFGLEQFVAFVRGFTPSLDAYLSTATPQREELSRREASVSSHREAVESFGLKWRELRTEYLAILRRAGTDDCAEPTEAQLFGQEGADSGGELGAVEAAIVAPVPEVVKDVCPDMQSALVSLKRALTAHEQLVSKHAARASSVRFKDLFEAVSALRGEVPNECPACMTPLDRVATNPFGRAEVELDLLQDLAELEDRIEEAWGAVNDNWAEVQGHLSRIEEQAASLGVDLSWSSPGAVPRGMLGRRGSPEHLHAVIAEVGQRDNDLSVYRTALESHNEAAARETEVRGRLRARRKVLLDVRQALEDNRARKRLLAKAAWEARSALRTFSIDTAELRKSCEVERVRVAENLEYLDAYAWLVSSLQSYAEARPGQLVQDLGEMALGIYNEINVYDPDAHKLAELMLPKAAGDRLEIRFRADPEGMRHSALHVMSEGHIRCLGLAILLAKSVHENVPVLIFDDVVNAIDDEHRTGVAQVLMRGELLTKKQVVVTTHGEEFVKTLETCLPAREFSTRVRRIDLEKPGVVDGVSIRRTAAPRHYVFRARAALKDGLLRDSLAHSRRGLENISHRLWLRTGKAHDVRLSVSMSAPTATPELRSVVQSLLSKMKDLQKLGETEDRKEVIARLEEMLTYWSYLNKGTHDEEPREEFDANAVERIVTTIEALADVVLKDGVRI